MKKITNYWRYLTLFLMLFGVMSFGYAQVSVVIPDADLGNRALGSWAEGTTVTIMNDGAVDVTITSLDLDDASGYYSFVGPDLPYDLAAGANVPVTMNFNAPLGSAVGTYEAVFVATFNPAATRNVAAGNLIVTAYDPIPVPWDVVENANEWTYCSTTCITYNRQSAFFPRIWRLLQKLYTSQ